MTLILHTTHVSPGAAETALTTPEFSSPGLWGWLADNLPDHFPATCVRGNVCVICPSPLKPQNDRLKKWTKFPFPECLVPSLLINFLFSENVTVWKLFMKDNYTNRHQTGPLSAILRSEFCCISWHFVLFLLQLRQRLLSGGCSGAVCWKMNWWL